MINLTYTAYIGDHLHLKMAYKLFATGPGLNSGKTNVYNDIIVDKSGYESGKLSIQIDGPSRVTIRYIDNQDGTIKISYKPTIPGDYTINLKFNSFFLQGSPFRVKVRGAAPISLTKHGNGQIRASNSLKPATLTSSADFAWFNKLALNGGQIDVENFGGRSFIESARY